MGGNLCFACMRADGMYGLYRVPRLQRHAFSAARCFRMPLRRSVRAAAKYGAQTFPDRDVLPVPIKFVTVGKGNSQAAEAMSRAHLYACETRNSISSP